VEEDDAGVVPVPVAAMMDGSAWRRSHSMVWPSDLWPIELGDAGGADDGHAAIHLAVAVDLLSQGPCGHLRLRLLRRHSSWCGGGGPAATVCRQ
jgi:hypothetical protein